MMTAMPAKKALRADAVLRSLTVDLLPPLAVPPAWVLLMGQASTGLFLSPISHALLSSFTFVSATFDLAENGSVIGLLPSDPERMQLLAAILR